MRQFWEFATGFCSTGLVLMAIAGRPVQVSSQPVEILTQVVRGGSMCPRELCETRLVIYTDGSVLFSQGTQPPHRGHLPSQDVGRLQTLIRRTNFIGLQSKPYRGVCPTFYDSPKPDYYFYPPGQSFVIDTCKVEINPKTALFQHITALEAQVQQQITPPTPPVSPPSPQPINRAAPHSPQITQTPPTAIALLPELPDLNS